MHFPFIFYYEMHIIYANFSMIASTLHFNSTPSYYQWPNIMSIKILQVLAVGRSVKKKIVAQEKSCFIQLWFYRLLTYCKDLIEVGIRRFFSCSKVRLEIDVRRSVWGFQFSLPKWSSVRKLEMSKVVMSIVVVASE